MAYPMIPMPTLKAFRERAQAEFGCTYETLDKVVNGQPVTYRYLSRNMGDRTLHVPLNAVQEDQRLTPIVLESLCNKLRIPIAAFGLTLE